MDCEVGVCAGDWVDIFMLSSGREIVVTYVCFSPAWLCSALSNSSSWTAVLKRFQKLGSRTIAITCVDRCNGDLEDGDGSRFGKAEEGWLWQRRNEKVSVPSRC